MSKHDGRSACTPAVAIAFLKSGATLQQVGDKFGICRERVRQIALLGGYRQGMRRVPLNDDIVGYVIELLSMGYKIDDACLKAGTTVNAIRGKYGRRENIPGYNEMILRKSKTCPDCHGPNEGTKPLYAPRCLACGRKKNAVRVREYQERKRRAAGSKIKEGSGPPRKYP